MVQRIMKYVIAVKAFDGMRVVLVHEDWLHIRFRHPEVGPETVLLSKALTQPDEVYRNGRGAIHALRRLDERHFLVVIYERADDEGSCGQPI
jgi:hypothetical protein